MTTEIDPCPWHRDTQPAVKCRLVGCRDEPSVIVEMYCPKCHVTRAYAPTDAEVHEHYESRYSENHKMIKALAPKLTTLWNWKERT